MVAIKSCSTALMLLFVCPKSSKKMHPCQQAGAALAVSVSRALRNSASCLKQCSLVSRSTLLGSTVGLMGIMNKVVARCAPLQ